MKTYLLIASLLCIALYAFEYEPENAFAEYVPATKQIINLPPSPAPITKLDSFYTHFRTIQWPISAEQLFEKQFKNFDVDKYATWIIPDEFVKTYICENDSLCRTDEHGQKYIYEYMYKMKNQAITAVFVVKNEEWGKAIYLLLFSDKSRKRVSKTLFAYQPIHGDTNYITSVFLSPHTLHKEYVNDSLIANNKPLIESNYFYVNRKIEQYTIANTGEIQKDCDTDFKKVIATFNDKPPYELQFSESESNQTYQLLAGSEPKK